MSLATILSGFEINNIGVHGAWADFTFFEKISNVKFDYFRHNIVNQKQIKALADTEASLRARLIAANPRMQSQIYKILRPEQQKKLSDLERTHGAVISEGK